MFSGCSRSHNIEWKKDYGQMMGPLNGSLVQGDPHQSLLWVVQKLLGDLDKLQKGNGHCFEGRVQHPWAQHLRMVLLRDAFMLIEMKSYPLPDCKNIGAKKVVSSGANTLFV